MLTFSHFSRLMNLHHHALHDASKLSPSDYGYLDMVSSQANQFDFGKNECDLSKLSIAFAFMSFLQLKKVLRALKNECVAESVADIAIEKAKVNSASSEYKEFMSSFWQRNNDEQTFDDDFSTDDTVESCLLDDFQSIQSQDINQSNDLTKKFVNIYDEFLEHPDQVTDLFKNIRLMLDNSSDFYLSRLNQALRNKDDTELNNLLQEMSRYFSFDSTSGNFISEVFRTYLVELVDFITLGNPALDGALVYERFSLDKIYHAESLYGYKEIKKAHKSVIKNKEIVDDETILSLLGILALFLHQSARNYLMTKLMMALFKK